MKTIASIICFISGLLYPISILATPTIQHWQTANGVRVYFIAAPDLPMVDVEVTFDGGGARDAHRSGIASLTNNLLGEGAAGGLTADEIAQRFESLGAQLSNSTDDDTANLSLRSLTEPELLQPALETFVKVLSQPTFDPADFERLRQQQLAGLKYEQQRPGAIVQRKFYQAVFGQHPYANMTNGTVESVTAVTIEEVKAFYQRYYVAKNALIAMVGALERAEAEKLANTIAGSLPLGEAVPPLVAVPALTQAKTIHLEHPSEQTHILIGQLGMARKDPDYFALYVGNHIFGGNGLVSRVSKQIREERGLAYSVYSYFSPLQVVGPFLISLETRNDKMTTALQVVQATLRDWMEKGPTATELESSKKNITGGFALRIDSNSDLLGYLSVIGFYGLPLDYLDQFNHRIEAVTTKMIKDAFNRHLHLDQLVTVTVGGPQL
jgi:zinc protease